MSRARRVLLRLLPRRVGDAALADLDRELVERRSRGLSSGFWYAWEIARLMVHLRLALLLEGGRDALRPASFAPRRALHHAVRTLARTPAFTASAVLLLGAGIGGVTAIFALVDHLLLRPLPYPDADRLIHVNSSQSHPSLRDLDSMRSVEAWAAASVDDANLTGRNEPVRLRQARVTVGFFELFGADVVVGRRLDERDFVTGDAVVLSHDVWTRLWGGDPSVLGQTVRVDGTPVVVVGVLDASFAAPEALLEGGGADLWRPIDRAHPDFEERAWHVLVPAGRLAPDARLEDAQREAAAVAEQRARAFPDYYVRGDGSLVELPVETLQEATVGSAREGILLLLGGVALLLLLACANVAHLFVARGLGRFREMGVRRALGAGLPAVAGQLLSESFLIASGGALVGLLLGGLALRAFLLLSPVAIPRADALVLDARLFAFAATLSTVTALVFGLFPTLAASRGSLAVTLRGGARSSTGGRGPRSLRDGLVVAEVALSVVLVSCAGLFLQSFARMREQTLGFRVEDVWTIPVLLADEQDRAAGLQRLERMSDALGSVPGVRGVTYGLSVPLERLGGTCCWGRNVRPIDAGTGPQARIHPFGGDWPGVLEPRLIAGRAWSSADLAGGAPPTLLNEPLAVELFGSVERAVGEHVALADVGSDALPVPDHRVVGVVAEDLHYGLVQAHGRAAYVPMSSTPFLEAATTFAVRVEGPAAGDVAQQLREAVWSVEPDLPLPRVRTMSELAARATARTRFDAWIFSTFGVIALLLAAAGLYGTLLYAVALERREMGIRLALGAARRSVEYRVLRRGLLTAGLGAAVGGAGAWGATRLLQSRLFGIEPGDPVTLLSAMLVLLLTAALACWLPARRAGATDPLETLRQE